MWPIVAAPQPKTEFATVAATTATRDPGSRGTIRDKRQDQRDDPAGDREGTQSGSAPQARTARVARTRTFSACTSAPRAAGTCCKAMMTAMPTVKPSTTGTGT